MIRLRLRLILGQILVAACTCEPLFPAIFTFGDSMVDVGNNNYLATALAKANTPPNGIDFPTHNATGRFCNGKTVVDLIAEQVGLDYAPAYLAPTTRGEQLLQGVNYASGAAGILDESGAYFFGRLPLSTQISYFNDTVHQLNKLLRSSKATTLLAKSLYFVAMGTNDYIYNYLEPNSTMKSKYTLDQFHTFLASQLKVHVQTMYNLGARKIAVSSMGPIGCMPSRISLAGSKSRNNTCIAAENEMAQGFNAAVQEMIRTLTSSLPGTMILYVNTYYMSSEFLRYAAQEGFEVTFPGCCAFVGGYKGQIPCGLLNEIIDNSLCTNRNKYIFWDEFHPTEAVNILLSQKLLSGSTSYVTPMNLSELSQWTS